MNWNIDPALPKETLAAIQLTEKLNELAMDSAGNAKFGFEGNEAGVVVCYGDDIVYDGFNGTHHEWIADELLETDAYNNPTMECALASLEHHYKELGLVIDAIKTKLSEGGNTDA